MLITALISAVIDISATINVLVSAYVNMGEFRVAKPMISGCTKLF